MVDMKKIIFVHQGKTGGSTLTSAFRDTFSKNNIYRDVDTQKRHGKAWLIRFFESGMENWRKYQDRANFQVLHGHFSPEKYRKAFPEAIYITFYRHPIQKFISLYHYWTNIPVKPNQPLNPYLRILKSERLNIEDFAKLYIKKNIGSKKEIAQFRPDHFDFIGITEKFDLSIELLKLKHIPTLSVKTPAERVNPDKKVTELYNIDSKLYELLNDLLSVAIEQYDNAVERFQSDCRKAGLLE